MKKLGIIAIITILIIGAIVAVVYINLNKEKTPITALSFYNTMSGKGYNVQDATSQFSGFDYIKQAYIAVSKDYGYQIEFYEISDSSYATGFYNHNKSIFQSSKGISSAETSVELNNYAKYTLKTNDKYMIISRIDNTVIYVNVNQNYKDEVKSILDELGY